MSSLERTIGRKAMNKGASITGTENYDGLMCTDPGLPCAHIGILFQFASRMYQKKSWRSWISSTLNFNTPGGKRKSNTL